MESIRFIPWFVIFTDWNIGLADFNFFQSHLRVSFVSLIEKTIIDMNSFRTLIIIPYMALQLSGFFTIFSWEPRQLTELTREVRSGFSDDSPTKPLEAITNLPILRQDEIKCENSPICRKETPLKYVVQPPMLSKAKWVTPAKRAVKEKPNKNKAARWHIHFDGTGNAELF